MKRFCFGLVLLLVSVSASADQLRIVTWNTAGEARVGTAVVLEALGNVDVLALQEQSSNDTETILAAINGIHGENVYAIATPPTNARTSGGGLPGLIFNTQTIELVEAVAFGDVSTDAQADRRFDTSCGLRNNLKSNTNSQIACRSHIEEMIGSGQTMLAQKL